MTEDSKPSYYVRDKLRPEYVWGPFTRAAAERCRDNWRIAFGPRHEWVIECYDDA